MRGNSGKWRVQDLILFHRANLSCKAGIRPMVSTPLLLDAVTHSSPPQAVTRRVMELDSSNEEFCSQVDRFAFWIVTFQCAEVFNTTIESTVQRLMPVSEKYCKYRQNKPFNASVEQELAVLWLWSWSPKNSNSLPRRAEVWFQPHSVEVWAPALAV